MLGYIIETLSSLTSSPLAVVATGEWRKNYEEENSPFHRLKNALVSYFWSSYDLSIIPQSEEGSLAAMCAHRYMTQQGYMGEEGWPLWLGSGNVTESHTLSSASKIPRNEQLFLYVGAGRGSTQITLLTLSGEVKKVFKGPGYPKTGESPIEKLSDICDTIKTDYGNKIVAIFGYDSIFHILKKNCPVIPDGEKLPTQVTTKGSDFAELGYLSTHFPTTPMMVFRNFIIKDDTMRKITFLKGNEPMVDLGTGEAKLVDPRTGINIKTVELPSDWSTNNDSFKKVVNIIKTIHC